MDQFSARMKALGDPLRLRILKLLPGTDLRCEDVYNVTELATELGVAQPTVSHHLRLLKQAGIVRSRKMCRDVYYWIDRETIRECAEMLLREFGTPEPEPVPEEVAEAAPDASEAAAAPAANVATAPAGPDPRAVSPVEVLPWRETTPEPAAPTLPDAEGEAVALG